MQTFLPYADFDKSAQALDTQRLLKQIVEATQITSIVVASTMKSMTVVEKHFQPININMPKWLTGRVVGIGHWVEERVVVKDIAWSNHPATRMWVNHRWGLICYTYTMIREYERRGYDATVLRSNIGKFGLELTQERLKEMDDVQNELARSAPNMYYEQESFPRWLGLELFHSKHRATLLSKAPDFYGKYGWTEKPEYGYYWPA